MIKDKKEEDKKEEADIELQRQKIIDANGKKRYNDVNPNEKDSNILIDSEH